MKKVLIIAYAFPPFGVVGALRTLKFCKYLPSFGWQPIVLTINYTSIDYRDENTLKEIPKEALVYRTFDFDPLKLLNKQNKRKLEKTGVDRRTEQSIRKEPSILTKLKKFIFQLVTTPDIHIFWLPFALIKCIWIMLHHNIDVIFCSSPPHSPHIIALFVSKLFSKPYVADFRDPWLAYSIKRTNSRFLVGINRYLEKQVFYQASRILTVSKGCLKEISKNVCALHKNKFEIVYNGFDVKDFRTNPPLRPLTNSTKLILTHTGTIYKGIADEFFLNIERNLSNENDFVNKVEIRLLGYIPEENRKMIENTNLKSIVKYLGYKVHLEALEYMLQSDVLLLFMGGDLFMDGVLPAKLFEYMCAGKPILALTKQNEASEIIEKSNLGIIIDPQDETAFVESIVKLYDEKIEKGHLSRLSNVDYVRRFGRRYLTEKLARVFENAMYTGS